MDKIIKYICRNVANELFLLDEEANSTKNSCSKLIFPSKGKDGKKTDEIRISEQEARFLFCRELEKSRKNYKNYYYSVETPTLYQYSFSGVKKTSAMTDLTIHEKENDEYKRLVNVEFKAHNPDKDHIKKDIEKLVTEDVDNKLWFHLFKNEDKTGERDKTKNSVTVEILKDKFKYSYNNINIKDKDIRFSKIIFCICIIDKERLEFITGDEILNHEIKNPKYR